MIGGTTDASRGWLFFDLILAHAGVARSEGTAAALADLHAYHTASNLWEYVPDEVLPALEALRRRGLRIVVVSNANGTLRAHLDRLGMTSRFDVVLDSADEGVEKPDPRFFEIALERSGASRDTTIHVGDLYYVDVMGARAAGLRGDPARRGEPAARRRLPASPVARRAGEENRSRRVRLIPPIASA